MRSTMILAFVVACGDGPGDTKIRGEPTLETFEQRMCACTDAACANTVVRDMARWSKIVKTPPPGDARAIMDRLNACMAKATRR